VSRGATEDVVAKLADYEASDLPERTKVALRFADVMTGDKPIVSPELKQQLAEHFDEGQVLDLGMTIAFASGWQRFIEAVGIVPDRWSDDAPPPFRPLEGG
jgi:alkylhydroperoxidase family enzyme